MNVTAAAYPIFDPGGRNSQKKVNSVKVIQTVGLHDTAIITVRNEDTSAPELRPGTPVKMQYGWSPVDMDWFYGYVDHVESHYESVVPDAVTYEDVICLGTSFSLKDPFVGTWTNTPASSVAQQIAKQYFLSALIETGDFAWPSLSSTGCSAWAYLTQLADKVGYMVSCNKTLLRFVSIDTAIRERLSTMPVFRSRNAAPSYFTQSIVRFQAVQGESAGTPGGTKAVRTVSGMNPATGQMVGAINDTTAMKPNALGAVTTYPFFGQQVSDQVVTSMGHAQAVLNGMAQANRFSYQATASLSGLTSVKQGMVILIMGIDNNNDGMWWVDEVSHNISSASYSMDVTLGRDSMGDNGLRPTLPTAAAYSPNNPFVYSMTNAPPTILLANHWRAANQFNTYVGS